MNVFKSGLIAAAALLAAQAHAGFVTSAPVAPIPTGIYTAPTFTGTAAVETGSLTNFYLQPLGTSGSYMVVSAGGSATVNAFGASSYSFVWGSPDVFNSLTVYGSDFTKTYTGADFAAMPAPNNNKTFLFTITGTDGSTINSLDFASSGIAFEVAVAAVPEPETYALMLAGLGIVGFMAGRRRGA